MTFDFRIIEDAHQDLRFIHVGFIMYPAFIDAVTFIELYHTRRKSIQLNTPVIIDAESERLALLQEQGFNRLGPFFSKDLKCAIIEDVAILIDLQEGSTLDVRWHVITLPEDVWDRGPWFGQQMWNRHRARGPAG